MEPKIQKRSRLDLLNEVLADAQKRSYFVGAATVLFFVLFLILGVVPAYSDVLSQLSENGTINEAIEEARQKRADLESLVNQNLNESDLINTFNERILPDGDQQADIVDEVYGTAEELNLVVSNFVFSENVDTADLQAVWFLNPLIQSGQLRVEATGALDDVLAYVDFFDSSRRIYHTENISLFGDTDSSVIDVQDLESEEIQLDNDVVLGNVDNYKVAVTARYFYWSNTLLEDI